MGRQGEGRGHGAAAPERWRSARPRSGGRGGHGGPEACQRLSLTLPLFQNNPGCAPGSHADGDQPMPIALTHELFAESVAVTRALETAELLPDQVRVVQ